MAAHHWVYDYACVAVGLVGAAITGFMTMHAVTCRLTAAYGISSVPQHLTYEYGTYLYLYVSKEWCHLARSILLADNDRR